MSESDHPDIPEPTDRCPMCGGPNECGMARGDAECWCLAARITPAVLAGIPEKARGKVCICRRCAGQQDASASSPSPVGGRPD